MSIPRVRHPEGRARQAGRRAARDPRRACPRGAADGRAARRPDPSGPDTATAMDARPAAPGPLPAASRGSAAPGRGHVRRRRLRRSSDRRHPSPARGARTWRVGSRPAPTADGGAAHHRAREPARAGAAHRPAPARGGMAPRHRSPAGMGRPRRQAAVVVAGTGCRRSPAAAGAARARARRWSCSPWS